VPAARTAVPNDESEGVSCGAAQAEPAERQDSRIIVVCFLALVTDIVYSASVFLMWLHFSMADRRRQHSLRGQQRCQVDEARSVLRRYA
jgi:hypothetical protein